MFESCVEKRSDQRAEKGSNRQSNPRGHDALSPSASSSSSSSSFFFCRCCCFLLRSPSFLPSFLRLSLSFESVVVHVATPATTSLASRSAGRAMEIRR